MNKRVRINFYVTGVLFILFCLFTAAVQMIDVKPIGPEQSAVGFAAINGAVAGWIGVDLFWYELTDWLGIIAILAALGFAALGVRQLIKHRSIKRVDRGILVLGASYAMTVAAYVFFEVCIVNYRPVIIGGGLEASYPSSHSMVVVVIMATAMMQCRRLTGRKVVRGLVDAVSILVMVITVFGRIISGVHWFTDIVGGLLLAAVLIMFYYTVNLYVELYFL